MQVRAAIAWRPGDPLRIEDIELDEPRDDEILVRMVATGICHTDMNARDRRLPVELPMILGHEGGGVVERVGSAITSVAAGDSVLLTPDYCGRCPRCRVGQTTYCDHTMAVTFGGWRADGSPRAHHGATAVRAAFFGQSSFATYALATERNVLKVGADAPLAYLAALTCGIQTGAGAVLNAMPVRAGGTVGVIGTGAVGLAAVMAAAASGATEIVAVDRVAHRLELAAELGATQVIDTTSGVDISTEVHRRTGGCEVVLDTTGVPELIRSGVESLATRGTCGFVGGSGPDLTLPSMSLLLQGRSLRGIMGGDATPSLFLPRLISLYEHGRFPFDRLVRHYPFDDINTAIDDSLSGKTIKPVLTFP